MQARATWMIITGSTWNGTQRSTFLNDSPLIAFHIAYRDDLSLWCVIWWYVAREKKLIWLCWSLTFCELKKIQGRPCVEEGVRWALLLQGGEPDKAACNWMCHLGQPPRARGVSGDAWCRDRGWQVCHTTLYTFASVCVSVPDIAPSFKFYARCSYPKMTKHLVRLISINN